MEKDKVSMILKVSIVSMVIAVTVCVTGTAMLTCLYQKEFLNALQMRWMAMSLNLICVFFGVFIVKRNSALPGILISICSGLCYLLAIVLLDSLLFNGMESGIIGGIAAVVVGAFLGGVTSQRKTKRVKRK